MGVRTNQKYIITDCVHIGESELVLGVHSELPDLFVTWEYSKENDSYYWGHYYTDLFSAQRDLAARCQDKVRFYEHIYEPHKEQDIER